MFVGELFALSGLLQLTLYILWPPKCLPALFLRYFLDQHTVYLPRLWIVCQYLRPFNQTYLHLTWIVAKIRCFEYSSINPVCVWLHFLRLSLAQRGNIAKKLVQNGEKTIEIESYDKQLHISNIKCHLTKYGAFWSPFCPYYFGSACKSFLRSQRVKIDGIFHRQTSDKICQYEQLGLSLFISLKTRRQFVMQKLQLEFWQVSLHNCLLWGHLWLLTVMYNRIQKSNNDQFHP